MNTESDQSLPKISRDESFERRAKERLDEVIAHLNELGEASRKAGRHIAIPAVPPWAKPPQPKTEE